MDVYRAVLGSLKWKSQFKTNDEFFSDDSDPRIAVGVETSFHDWIFVVSADHLVHHSSYPRRPRDQKPETE